MIIQIITILILTQILWMGIVYGGYKYSGVKPEKRDYFILNKLFAKGEKDE
jgi:hypothetical protein